MIDIKAVYDEILRPSGYVIVEPSRVIPQAIKRGDGIIFNVGDTIVVFGEDGKGEKTEVEIEILRFSYDKEGELCWHHSNSPQIKNKLFMLDGALNKSESEFGAAILLLSKNGYDVIKKVNHVSNEIVS